MIGWEALEFHEMAELFPMLPAEELSAFADRIETEGYDERHPIVLYEGEILDGRNRWSACDTLRREGRLQQVPPFQQYEGDEPLAFVLRENLHRRHLSESQRGMVAARLATMKQGARTDLASIEARSQAQAADDLNVSRSTVQRAVAIQEKAPDLALQVDAGAMSLHEATREIGRRERPELGIVAPLPTGKFSVLYADPPWRYDFMRVDDWAVENHYPTLALPELEAMGDEVSGLTAKDAVLFLWGTAPKLPEALAVMQAWGFEYKTNMVWVKHENLAGMGYYARVGHEHLLIGTRGAPGVPLVENRPPSVIRAAKGAHSEKPVEARHLIEAMYPTARRIDLFSREGASLEWAVWGAGCRAAVRAVANS